MIMKKRFIAISFTLLCFITIGVGYKLIQDQGTTNSSLHLLNLNASTQSNEQKTIVIDAGHGGYDTGSIAEDGTYEKDINLEIALQIGEILTESGYNVMYTRTSDDVTWSNDNKDDLATRVAIAEQANADYFISIHLNASDNYNDGAYGFEIYQDNSNSVILAMAEALEYKLDRLSYSLDRGIKDTDDSSLYVIDQNNVPAMLIELGFITDCDDIAYITSTSGQHLLAQSIAESIMLYC